MSRKMYYRVGTRVRIAQCCCAKRGCEHTGQPGCIVKIDRSMGTRCPVIQLDRRKKLLWGFQCWWTTERIYHEVTGKGISS